MTSAAIERCKVRSGSDLAADGSAEICLGAAYIADRQTGALELAIGFKLSATPVAYGVLFLTGTG